MQKIPLPISFSESSANSLTNSPSSLTNLYVKIQESGSKSNYLIQNTEGYQSIFSVVTGNIFGLYEFQGYLYIATSTKLLRRELDNSSASIEELGTIEINQKAIFADNGISIVMVANDGCAYTPGTSTFEDMTAKTGWYDSDTVAYMDGYFIFNRTNTGQFFISELYSTDIDPIDWATGEAAPDDTVGVVVASRQLWLIGEKTCEVWHDSGDSLFPFTRISGAVTDIGCASYKTIATMLSSIFFVGSDMRVYQTQGYTPVPISTPAIEDYLQGFNNKYISGFTYHIDGQWRYILHIDAEYTFIYEVNSGQWSRISSKDIERWAITGSTNVYQTNNTYGYSNNEVYRLDTSLYTEDGVPIKRELITMPINKGVDVFTLPEVQIEIENAIGKETDNTSWFMETSRDGGRKYGVTMEGNTGNWGDTLTRTRWTRLGQFRNCTLKFHTYSPRMVRVIGLYIRTS